MRLQMPPQNVRTMQDVVQFQLQSVSSRRLGEAQGAPLPRSKPRPRIFAQLDNDEGRNAAKQGFPRVSTNDTVGTQTAVRTQQVT